MVKSIILAAGKGTRMKSETPKVLHKIFDKTLVGYVIEAVNNTGLVSENFAIVGHQAELVDEYIKGNYKNTRTVLQSPQLGTGHAVSMALPYLEDYSGEVIILCGDTPLINSETLKEFIENHRSLKSDLTVMTAIYDDPTNYGQAWGSAYNNGKDVAAHFELAAGAGNLTYADVFLESLYSISASAKAVSQSVHQYTGFNPLYIYPFLYISANTPICFASICG